MVEIAKKTDYNLKRIIIIICQLTTTILFKFLILSRFIDFSISTINAVFFY